LFFLFRALVRLTLSPYATFLKPRKGMTYAERKAAQDDYDHEPHNARILAHGPGRVLLRLLIAADSSPKVKRASDEIAGPFGFRFVFYGDV
jgi:hypothetical protein